MALWSLLGVFVLSLLILSLLSFALVSLREKERRAAVRSGLVSAALGLGLAALFAVTPGIRDPVLITLLGCITLISLWLAASPRPRGRLIVRDPPERIDERDIIFARFDLQEGTPRFAEYYARRPQYQETDAEIRKLPDILSSSHLTKAPALFALADAEFEWLEHQLVTVDGPVRPGRGSRSAEANTRLVKETVRYLGADLCGVCEMEPAFIYSHVGRGPEPYGKQIELDHSFAIVFAVQMDFSMIAAAASVMGIFFGLVVSASFLRCSACLLFTSLVRCAFHAFVTRFVSCTRTSPPMMLLRMTVDFPRSR